MTSTATIRIAAVKSETSYSHEQKDPNQPGPNQGFSH